MKIRKPCTTATMWSSGKITCTGARRYIVRMFLLILEINLLLIKIVNQMLIKLHDVIVEFYKN